MSCHPDFFRNEPFGERLIRSGKNDELTPDFPRISPVSCHPDFFRNEPFGENVEGLSHCGGESYAIEYAVQKHDFEQTTLFGVVVSIR